MRLLWFVDLDYPTRFHHGGLLRVFNLSQNLLTSGHQVWLAVQVLRGGAQECTLFLTERRNAGVFTEFSILVGPPPSDLRQFLRRSGMVRAGRQHAVAGALDLANKNGFDVCLVTNRRFLFLLDHADHLPPIAVDWCDSRVLQLQRQISYLAAKRRCASLPDILKQLLYNWREERRYGRRSAWNFAVSPVDLSCINRVRGRPDRMTLLPNGVAPRQFLPLAKEPYRLIFSGNMDFPPNYESALWFIDEVFPRVLEAAPEARLVIAGANPIEELRRRSSARIQVLGYVENMEEELARSALYVAPLISGSGFRNKVTEALVQGTFVVGTTLAGEFLDDDLRPLLLSADTPATLAQKIVWGLQHPDEVRSAVCVLSTKILDRYSWPSQSLKLESVLQELIEEPERDLGGRR